MSLSSDAQALMAKLNKEHPGSIILGSEMAAPTRITTGSLAMDVALGGGWPVNQWSEVYGKESNGKTSILYKTIAANQAIDPDWTVAWIAGEHYDFEQAAALGVDNSRVIIIDTQEMETAYDTALNFIESKTVDCCVIDSYPALVPIEEADKSIGESVVAVGARLTGKFFRKMGQAMNRQPGDRPITCFFVNQVREKIGGFSPRGTPTTTPGGTAKNYAAYVRVEISRADFIDEPRPGKGKVRVGQEIKMRTVKNKSAAPQQVATTRFFFRDAPYLGFNRGDYDLAAEYMAYALSYDIITRGGAIYRYGDRKWKGQEEVLTALREDVDLQHELRDEILRLSQIPDRERIKVEK